MSSNLRTLENAPIVKKDNVLSAANKTDHSEGSYVFCSSPPRQRDSESNHSTVNLQQCSCLEKEDKQENVRDLIARIKYIKSRLDRAESDYRKKGMLKSIIGLQKRVKALFKDMKKETMDPSKEQQGTRSYNEELPGHGLADNTALGSQGSSRTGRELPTNHVMTDQGTGKPRFLEKERTKSKINYWNKIPLFNSRPYISMVVGTFSSTHSDFSY